MLCFVELNQNHGMINCVYIYPFIYENSLQETILFLISPYQFCYRTFYILFSKV